MGAATPTSTKQANAVVRQHMALVMRADGMSVGEIARQLGYASHAGAINAIDTAMQTECPPELVAQVRAMELLRLDELWTLAIARARTGYLPAIDRCLAIMERRTKYVGADAPIRIQAMVITEQDMREAIDRMRQQRMVIEGTAIESGGPVIELESPGGGDG